MQIRPDFAEPVHVKQHRDPEAFFGRILFLCGVKNLQPGIFPGLLQGNRKGKYLGEILPTLPVGSIGLLTDDVGNEDYNLGLSERRAGAVRDYLVEAGITENILSIQGWGKKQPLVQGTSDEARAKNRRVELGIVNVRINYPRAPRD